jgi:mono/diheme cytochrome c family protein
LLDGAELIILRIHGDVRRRRRRLVDKPNQPISSSSKNHDGEAFAQPACLEETMKRLAWFALSAALVCGPACGDDDSGDDGEDSGTDGGNNSQDAAMTEDSGSRMDSGARTDSGMPAEDSGTPIEELVARGEYLVSHVAVCGDCHTPRNPDGSFDTDRLLAGVECFVDAVPDDPDTGCLSSRNLTDHETGLRNRSDAEIKDMFMKGERPDGTALHPFMPYYVLGNMRDSDADAIVAYLRTVDGVDHMIPPNQPPFEAPDEPAPLWPEHMIPMPREDYANQEAALRGRYLAGNIGICMECHTQRDDMGSPILALAFQGGEGFGRAELGLPPIFPEVIYSANITPHANGIADWTVNDVVRALKQGEDKDQGGAPICPPMPAGPMGAFGGLTDADARDIGHYLLSIPPGDNMVPSDCVAMPPPEPDDGGTDDDAG